MLILQAAPALFALAAIPTAPSQEAQTAIERPAGKAGQLELGTKLVSIQGWGTFDVEAGHLLVPERRDVEGSPPLSIPFYRIPCLAADPAPPIFLLAGGPGSSWIDMFTEKGNFEDLQRFAEYADVVLFDQRGAGHSEPRLSCEHHDSTPLDELFEVEVWGQKMRGLAAECRATWQARGVDLAG